MEVKIKAANEASDFARAERYAVPGHVIPAARRDDRYARGVGGAAAREINKIPAALPNENGQWTGPPV